MGFLLLVHGILQDACNLPMVMEKGACTRKKATKKMKKKKRPKKLVRTYAALYYFAIFVVSLKVRIKSHKSFEVDANIFCDFRYFH